MSAHHHVAYVASGIDACTPGTKSAGTTRWAPGAARSKAGTATMAFLRRLALNQAPSVAPGLNKHLRAGWPDGDRRSRLVFVARGLDPAIIERSFRAFSGGVPHTSSE